MTPPTLAVDDESFVESPPRADGSGAQELAAAALLALATAFFWWRGFRTFTVAGAALFIVALIGLADHRRRASDSQNGDRSRIARVVGAAILVAVLAFPALLLSRWLGPAPSASASAGADLWLGAVLYVMGVMELVELATLRALDES